MRDLDARSQACNFFIVLCLLKWHSLDFSSCLAIVDWLGQEEQNCRAEVLSFQKQVVVRRFLKLTVAGA